MSGRELRMDSTRHRIVPNFSRVKVYSPIIRTINLFAERTAISHKPPKCGALDGLQCHVHGSFAIETKFVTKVHGVQQRVFGLLRVTLHMLVFEMEVVR